MHTGVLQISDACLACLTGEARACIDTWFAHASSIETFHESVGVTTYHMQHPDCTAPDNTDYRLLFRVVDSDSRQKHTVLSALQACISGTWQTVKQYD